ncbi:hypothetical protein M2140_000784 [Clostridiales Family XIII bacterium PM5-7]
MAISMFSAVRMPSSSYKKLPDANMRFSRKRNAIIGLLQAC